MENQRRIYNDASQLTSHDLKTIANNELGDVTPMSLPEIDKVVNLIGNLLPAGNIPGIILRGLNAITGRTPNADNVRRDINALFHGVERTLDTVVYATFFAGPAAVIWGYQNLLRLAGKNPEDAFPEGTWQFYVDYALREDTARHANETHGFDSFLATDSFKLNSIDRMTAWVMASIQSLHNYHLLLENEWRERVFIKLLNDLTNLDPDAPPLHDLYSVWEKIRPYGYFTEDPDGSLYPRFRAERFDDFLFEYTSALDHGLIMEWAGAVANATDRDLPAYLNQMSILGYLKPDVYNENRIPLPIERAYVALFYEGHYYMIPACQQGTRQPNTVEEVRGMIAALTAYPAEDAPTSLRNWVTIQRATHPALREKLTPQLVKDMDIMRLCPIVLSFDQQNTGHPLAKIRQGERGTGDQAMTVFDTGQTFVFDQSHIYFDGTWGAAFAQIMTNEAINWAAFLAEQDPPRMGRKRPFSPALRFAQKDWESIKLMPRTNTEAYAESDRVNLERIVQLRRLFKARNDLISVTVNDLLIIYRAIHAFTYVPHPSLVEEIRKLDYNSNTHKLSIALQDLLMEHSEPATLIPIDATRKNPRDRLYPITFKVPLYELDLLNLHSEVIARLEAYRYATDQREAYYDAFSEAQQQYLTSLAGLGAVLTRAKETANADEGSSISTVKMLAHLPTPLQRLLDQIPNRFDVLNDIIKGREVFSNVGRVAVGSSLLRFVTAKDDNDKKTLCWGVLTDNDGVMRITLRDFRPHVGDLFSLKRAVLAHWIAQDYLDAYVEGLNAFVDELYDITVMSRETRPSRP